MIITAIAIGLIFWLGGFPILQSFAFSILLVAITFVLGAIAVKVGGEVGTVPVSGTSFLCLMLLVLVFGGLNLVMPYRSSGQLVIMALVGTTVFGSAISLSSDIIWEFAKDYILLGDDLKHKRNLLKLASTAWNIGNLPPETRKEALDQYMESLKSQNPEVDEDDILLGLREDMEKLIQKKVKNFNFINTKIIDAEINEEEKDFKIKVASVTF